jgi:hypothetical protein
MFVRSNKPFRLTQCRPALWAAGALALALVFPAILSGCEGDSAETLVRNIAFQVSGIYRNPGDSNNGKLVSNNTGSPVTQMDLRQTGDQLEAIDNNGLIFKGTIGNASDTEGSFTLEGQTTAGQPATLSGSIRKSSGDSTEAEMRGTWIEPSLFGTVVGVATVPPNRSGGSNTNNTGGGGSGGNISVSPSFATLANDGDTQVFTATGGNGNFSWSVGNISRGSVTPPTGPSVTYTRLTAGINILNVQDTAGHSANVNIQQPTL